MAHTKNYLRYVIGVDPSGNFNEGKGHTGFAVYDRTENSVIATFTTSAEDYKTVEEYYYQTWLTLFNLYLVYPGMVAIEDYRIYESKSREQINSLVETPRILGYLTMKCWENNIPYKTRMAAAVKSRWTDEILEHNGYTRRTALTASYSHCKGHSGYSIDCSDYRLMSHELDAIRHAVHCGKLEVKEDGLQLHDND